MTSFESVQPFSDIDIFIGKHRANEQSTPPINAKLWAESFCTQSRSLPILKSQISELQLPHVQLTGLTNHLFESPLNANNAAVKMESNDGGDKVKRPDGYQMSQAVSLSLRLYGNPSREYAQANLELANWHLQNGNLKAAGESVESAKHALPRESRTEPIFKAQLLHCESNIARAKGDDTTADTLLREAKAQDEKSVLQSKLNFSLTVSGKPGDVALALTRLAEFHLQKEKEFLPELAGSYLRNSIEILEKKHGKDSPHLLPALLTLANLQKSVDGSVKQDLSERISHLQKIMKTSTAPERKPVTGEDTKRKSQDIQIDKEIEIGVENKSESAEGEKKELDQKSLKSPNEKQVFLEVENDVRGESNLGKPLTEPAKDELSRKGDDNGNASPNEKTEDEKSVPDIVASDYSQDAESKHFGRLKELRENLEMAKVFYPLGSREVAAAHMLIANHLELSATTRTGAESEWRQIVADLQQLPSADHEFIFSEALYALARKLKDHSDERAQEAVQVEERARQVMRNAGAEFSISTALLTNPAGPSMIDALKQKAQGSAYHNDNLTARDFYLLSIQIAKQQPLTGKGHLQTAQCYEEYAEFLESIVEKGLGGAAESAEAISCRKLSQDFRNAAQSLEARSSPNS